MNDIIVFGGKTGKNQHSCLIEKYNEIKDQWEEIPFKLPNGIEAGTLIPGKNNEVIIIGGIYYNRSI